MSSSEEVIIRNFNLMKKVFDNLDVLSTFYGLSQRDINTVTTLVSKHSSYNAYIEIKISEFSETRRVVYRSLDKLENENIVTIVERPRNQHGHLRVYFTVSFITQVCGEEFAQVYEKWLDWQKSYKIEKGEDE